jgi:hypothetical protein
MCVVQENGTNNGRDSEKDALLAVEVVVEGRKCENSKGRIQQHVIYIKPRDVQKVY